MAKKWNPAKNQYEPYTIPQGWFCPLLIDDMDAFVNCASCGNEIRFGEGYSSHLIHSEMGMGYSVCGECLRKEYALENAARKEEDT